MTPLAIVVMITEACRFGTEILRGIPIEVRQADYEKNREAWKPFVDFLEEAFKNLKDELKKMKSNEEQLP